MELKNNNFQDVVIGAEKEMNFSIEGDNHIIFEILRDKMYSDKIAAICREVSCNARDANREAGRGNIPIDISIITPDDILTQTNRCLIIKDRGVGITPERMEDVFIKYGSSTKRDTNAQTGGFGLGAKTPFAYSDSFTIVTVCRQDQGNVRYEYSAIIDSTGKGKMILFDSKPTNQKTGTQIIVPIKNDNDTITFQKQCIQSTLLWDIVPNFTGFSYYSTIPQINKALSICDDQGEEIGFYINKYVSEHSGHIIRLDGISYPLPNRYLEKYGSCMNNHQLVLVFETGELSISANREQLQFDDETIAIIRERLEQIKLLSENWFNKSIELNTDTPIRKSIFINKIIGSSNDCKDSIERDIYHQFSLTLSKKLKLSTNIKTDRHTAIVVSWDKVSNKFMYDQIDSCKVSDTWDQPIIYMESGRKDSRKNVAIMKQLAQIKGDNEENWTDYRFIILQPSTIRDRKYLDECEYYVNHWQLHFLFYEDIVRCESFKSINTYKKKEVVSFPIILVNQTSINDWTTRRRHTNKIDCDWVWFERSSGVLYDDRECQDELDLSNTVYVTVETLRNIKGTESILLQLFNYLNKHCKVTNIWLITNRSTSLYVKDKLKDVNELINEEIVKSLDNLIEYKNKENNRKLWRSIDSRRDVEDIFKYIEPLLSQRIITEYKRSFSKSTESKFEFLINILDQTNLYFLAGALKPFNVNMNRYKQLCGNVAINEDQLTAVKLLKGILNKDLIVKRWKDEYMRSEKFDRYIYNYCLMLATSNVNQNRRNSKGYFQKKITK